MLTMPLTLTWEADLARADRMDGVSSIGRDVKSPAAVWTGEHVYVFGGYDMAASFTLDEIYRFDPATNTATRMGAKLPVHREEASAAWDGRYAYVFGGRVGGQWLQDIVRYDPVADRAETMPTSLPSGRYGTSAVWLGSHAYVFGGVGAPRDIVRYDPVAGQVKIVGDLGSDREHNSAVSTGSVAYVFGGNFGGGDAAQVLRFDPSTNQVASMGVTVRPGLFYQHSSVWDGRYAYIFGDGSDGTTRRYDPVANQVTKMDASGYRKFTAAVWAGTAAYVIGGEWTGIINRYQPYDPPSVPGAPSALAGASPDELLVRWSGPATDGGTPITRFNVYRGSASGELALHATPGPAAREFSDRGLPAGATYYYQVSAVNAAGEGPRTPEVSARTNQPPIPAIAPVAPAECTAGRGSVVLDARGSRDPDGDPLTYRWSGPGATFADATAAVASGSFLLGQTTATLTVADGKVSAAASAAVLVRDLLPPATTATPGGLPGSPGWWRSNVTVTLAAQDLCGSATRSFASTDGAPAQEGTTHAVRGDGTHTLVAYSEDAAGNRETPGPPLMLSIDTTPPSTAHTAPPPDGQDGWHRRPVDLVVSATDATSGVAATRLRVNGGAWQHASSVTVASDSPAHAVDYVADDVAGNTAPAKTAGFRIDATPPVTVATLAGTAGSNGWWRSAVTVTFAATDATSGVARTEHNLDEGGWRTGTSLLVAGDGVHAVRFRTWDLAGNVEPEQALTVAIDATPPALTLDAPARGGAWVLDQRAPLPASLPATLVVGAVTAHGNATDATSGLAAVDLLVDGAAVATSHQAQPYGLPWDAARAPAGAHVLAARARDHAGNEATRTVNVTSVPTTAAGALATECRFLAAPEACAAAPLGPLPRPDLELVAEACRRALPATTCADVVAFLRDLAG